ncbi:hypothetical protein GCM10017673_06420 [Streptosporangium violaceochromogenes]|nr:hypothetical protein GCM10017673_06420 [Streptosporangium violaceochromogenes]
MPDTSRLQVSAPRPPGPVKDLRSGGPPPGEPESPRRRRLRRLSAWLPATLAGVLTVAVLGRYGVSGRDMALFGLYVVLGLALPGVLLVRALWRGSRTVGEEIALGLALGYAVEVIAYIAARAVGAPLLVALWPVATYLVFLAAPGLRRHWTGAVRPRAPLWWSWSSALAVGYLVAWSAASFFRFHALTWPELGTADIDMPYHLALIGELRHHVPPTVPIVAGEPLSYHWFVYAHFAAASRLTGVEPLVLLFRLGMLPMMAALIVLIGTVARRLTGSWTAAPLAMAGVLLVAAPNLYQGINVGVFTWRAVQSWVSPTQTFGALLFAPIVLLLVEAFERRRQAAGAWPVLCVLLVAVMGAKATYLPVLTCGLVAVLGIRLVRHRRISRPALAALGATAACMLYAKFVLFGQAQLGMIVDPFALTRKMWGGLTGLEGRVEPPLVPVLGITLLYALSWIVEWFGIFGLLSRPRLLLRPAVVLMLGIGLSGLGAVIMLGHPHRSQLHFFVASYPYLVIVAVYGLLVVTRRARPAPRVIAGAVAGAALVTHLVRTVWGVGVPLAPGDSELALYRPYAVLGLLALAAVCAFRLLSRRRLVAGALTVLVVSAAGLPAAWCTRVLSAAFPSPASGGAEPGASGTAPAVPAVPAGVMEAGRWLRDHSVPDDLVATNTHCRWGLESPCDSRAFWVSALTERRVLVEGWAFTPANYRNWRPGIVTEYLPFWDRERLALNDAAFGTPSAASIGALRDRYGVSWLFVDERRAGPDVARFATLCFRSGDYAVYRVRGALA